MDYIIGLFINIIVIGTIIWVGYDSAKLMKDIPKEARKQIGGGSSPAVWVIGCLLLWIIVFPWYLAKRSKYLSFSESQYKVSGPRQCPSCSKFYEGDPSFCPNCGAKLKET